MNESKEVVEDKWDNTRKDLEAELKSSANPCKCGQAPYSAVNQYKEYANGLMGSIYCASCGWSYKSGMINEEDIPNIVKEWNSLMAITK